MLGTIYLSKNETISIEYLKPFTCLQNGIIGIT